MGTKSFHEKIGLTAGLKGKVFVIQGFGNVGYWAAKFFEKDGALITGITEYNSAIYNKNGINVEDAKAYFTAKGTFEGFTGAEEVELVNPLSFMEKPCDFLLPAAVEKSIHKQNASKL